jgi:crotonobetainyl-CoA:carnitine CoA-transferase CaiB-like acyl-CoA transferase
VINDMATALYAFSALAPALYIMGDGVPGRYLDISLMRGAANLSAIRYMSASKGKAEQGPRTAPSGIFQCAEGWLQLVILQDKDFDDLCAILELDDLAADDSLRGNEARLRQAHMLIERVGQVLATKAAAHWRELFTEAGLQNEMLQDYRQFIAHPQAVETELFSAFELPGLEQPLPVPNPPGIPKIIDGTPAGTSPVTGQHSDEILDEMGYGAEAIADLRRRGVITTWTEQATEQGAA